MNKHWNSTRCREFKIRLTVHQNGYHLNSSKHTKEQNQEFPEFSANSLRRNAKIVSNFSEFC